jgi:uncharacterized protein
MAKATKAMFSERRVGTSRSCRGCRRLPIVSSETHFAWVFLTKAHAYKLKKPLRRAGMDYRTLAARARGCRAELQLNRRLAPSVYQSLELLSVDRAGALHWGPGARIEEHIIRMRRIPATSMMSHALRSGRFMPRDLDRVIARLVGFFRRARRHGVSARAYLARLRTEVRQNRRMLRGHALEQGLVSAACEAQQRFVERYAAALGARGALVIEGHGDLRAEHVWLGPVVSVIDCLEFSRDLRLLDPAYDLAALGLDSARLGPRGLGLEMMRRYRDASGDAIADGLLLFYLGLCAATRAKLAVWHIGDRQYPNPRPWLRRANSYLRYAVRYSRQALQVMAKAGSPAALPSAAAR